MQAGNYYQVENFMFKVKQSFPQPDELAKTVLVDDWVGFPSKDLTARTVGGELMLDIPSKTEPVLVENGIAEQNCINGLIGTVNLTSNSTEPVAVPIRLTPERRELVLLLSALKRSIFEELSTKKAAPKPTSKKSTKKKVKSK